MEGAQRTGGRFGSLDYPSPIVVGERLFYLNGSGQMFVFDLNDNAKQIAVNRVTTEKESFGGTPAVSNGRMILRSESNLYCVTDLGQTVSPDDIVAATPEETAPSETGQQGGNRGGGGGGADGNRRFAPMSIFKDRGANQDGKLTSDELAGSPLADRIDQLDKDGDKAVSQEEFRSGMSAMFSGGRGGNGGGGGGNYRGGGNDSRPNRPQRPEMAE